MIRSLLNWKIQLRKIAVQFDGLCIPCSCGLNGGVEDANMHLNTIRRYLGAPAQTLAMYAKVSRPISSAWTSVTSVLSTLSKPQIHAPVVQCIAAYMIHFHASRRSHDYAMEKDSLPVETSDYIRPSIGSIPSYPVEVRNASKVTVIHQGLATARKVKFVAFKASVPSRWIRTSPATVAIDEAIRRTHAGESGTCSAAALAETGRDSHLVGLIGGIIGAHMNHLSCAAPRDVASIAGAFHA